MPLPDRVRRIVKATAANHGVPAAAIVSRSQVRNVSAARQSVWAALRQRATCTQIARWFERDHTTILAGLKQHARRAIDEKT